MNTRLYLDLMCYLRYKRQFPFVASEVFIHSIADVVALSKGIVHEFEIKTSRVDLWRELKDKSKKHKSYLDASSFHFVPNYFYLTVPEKLVDEALKFSDLHQKKYGVIVWKPTEFKRSYKHEPNVYVIRKPKRLFEGKHPKFKMVKRNLVMRMSSELIIYKMKIEKQKEKV